MITSAGRRTAFDPAPDASRRYGAGLAQKKQKLLELEDAASRPDFWNDPDKAGKISQEIADLKEEIQTWQKLLGDSKALKELLDLAQDEQAQKEIEERFSELQGLYEAERKKMFLSGPYDKGDAVLTIHAGAGGDDAEDWVGILYEMYLAYAKKQNWTLTPLHTAKSEAGIKTITFEVDGKFAFGFLKNESGVHRLVRISPFSSKGLRHTSFALVEVAPKRVGKEEIEIKDEDIEISFARSSGPGGQNVNKRETAVRIKHIPSGIQVHVESGRSQQQNRERALELLRSKLYQKREEAQKQKKEKERKEKGQEIEWGHQIRSYVFHPYKMVKDHRTGVETSNLENVLSGGLEKFIQAELEL